MPSYDGWETLHDENDPKREKMLGKGGQGEVYLVRSPEQSARRSKTAKTARNLLIQVSGGQWDTAELAEKLVELGRPDPDESLGALKKFIIPVDNSIEESQAVGRLESEVHALETLRDTPGVLKLLHANIPGRIIVTEFHPRGTLDKHPAMYKGNVLAALEAFLPLVVALCGIHSQGAIHRDIKLENIFVTASGSAGTRRFWYRVHRRRFGKTHHNLRTSRKS